MLLLTCMLSDIMLQISLLLRLIHLTMSTKYCWSSKNMALKYCISSSKATKETRTSYSSSDTTCCAIKTLKHKYMSNGFIRYTNINHNYSNNSFQYCPRQLKTWDIYKSEKCAFRSNRLGWIPHRLKRCIIKNSCKKLMFGFASARN